MQKKNPWEYYTPGPPGIGSRARHTRHAPPLYFSFDILKILILNKLLTQYFRFLITPPLFYLYTEKHNFGNVFLMKNLEEFFFSPFLKPFKYLWKKAH